MEVIKKQLGEWTLTSEDLRAIRGGSSDGGISSSTNGSASSTAGFPCTVREKDGTTRTKQVSSVQECLEFAGKN